jgi:hypothetical protein
MPKHTYWLDRVVVGHRSVDSVLQALVASPDFHHLIQEAIRAAEVVAISNGEVQPEYAQVVADGIAEGMRRPGE